VPFGTFPLSKHAAITPLNNYSCSPPGVGAVSDSVALFFFELFLPEGLAPVSSEDSEVVEPVAFSPLLDFFELFVLEPDLVPVGSSDDSLAVASVDSLLALRRVEVAEPGVVPPFARPALRGEALA